MKIYNVSDPEFTNYGRIIEGYEEEKKAIVEALKSSTPVPEGTDYVAEEPALQSLEAASSITNSLLVAQKCSLDGATVTTQNSIVLNITAHLRSILVQQTLFFYLLRERKSLTTSLIQAKLKHSFVLQEQ